MVAAADSNSPDAFELEGQTIVPSTAGRLMACRSAWDDAETSSHAHDSMVSPDMSRSYGAGVLEDAPSSPCLLSAYQVPLPLHVSKIKYVGW